MEIKMSDVCTLMQMVAGFTISSCVSQLLAGLPYAWLIIPLLAAGCYWQRNASTFFLVIAAGLIFGGVKAWL